MLSRDLNEHHQRYTQTSDTHSLIYHALLRLENNVTYYILHEVYIEMLPFIKA